MRNAQTPRVVKKYGNRRLYDTAESRYITLDELASAVRGGVDVRVIDAQSGDDLTQTVLLQVIIEGRGAAQFLSVPILTQLVRMSDDALGDFLGRWLSAAMELYQHARSGITSVIPYNPLSVPYAAGNLLARVLSAVPGPWMPPNAPSAGAYPGAFPDPPAELPGTQDRAADTDASIEALRREVEALKRSVRGDATAPAPQRNNAAKSARSVKKRASGGPRGAR